MRHPLRHPDSSRVAFTLLEVLLVLALLSLLLAVVASTSIGSSPRSELESSAEALAGTMRMAIAESALQGRRVRLSWNPEAAALVVEIESQPLASPGVFSALPARRWTTNLLADKVSVSAMDLRDGSAINILSLSDSAIAAATAPGGLSGGEGSFASILFYPDGHCDSSEISLRHSDLPNRRALLTSDEMTGTIEVKYSTVPEEK
jgi:type II secretory pathway pseudopilin PulG